MSDDYEFIDDEIEDAEEADGSAAVVGYEPPAAVRIAEVSAELSELVNATAELMAEDEQEPEGAGMELITGGGDAAALDAKRRMNAMRVRAAEARELIQAKQAELDSLLRRQLAEAEALMDPLKKKVAMLGEGIWTISLYLGSEEEIHRLRDGEPAPADTPITVRQMVLYMDEECAVAADSGGIEAKTIEQFDAWLLEDSSHLDQVLPEQKGIVALQPRRRTKGRSFDEIGAALRASQEEQDDRMAYLLIRNGERLFRLFIDTQLVLGPRLVPAADEFRLAAKDVFGDELRPGSHRWEEELDKADYRRRHFMRIAMILEGLVHRTTVLQPLPSESVSFLDDESHRSGRVVFLRDAELALTDGRESFREWHRRTMAELREGERVVGIFNYDGFGRHRTERGWGNDRLTPPKAGAPTAGVPYVVERRTERRGHGSGLFFRYFETEERWMNEGSWSVGELRMPQRRASCEIQRSDDWILPFDRVTPDQLRSFMADRASREHYLTLFPLFRSMLRAKTREATIERPFREMLIGRMMAENEVSLEDATADVDELITWYKTKTALHRPLLVEAGTLSLEEAIAAGDSEHPDERFESLLAEAGIKGRLSEGARDILAERYDRVREEAQANAERATRMIVAEHGRVLRDRRRRVSAPRVAELLACHADDDVLAVVRPRGEGYKVIVAAGRGPYVHEFNYAAQQKGMFDDFRAERAPSKWQLIGKRDWRWVVAWESPKWATWDRLADPSKHFTGPEVEEVEKRVAEAIEGDVLAVIYDEHGFPTTWWVPSDGVKVQKTEVAPRRAADGSVQARPRTTAYWRGVHRDSDSDPWERAGAIRDARAIARWRERRRLANVEESEKQAVRDRVDRLTEQIEEAWVKREDRERYVAFLAEYADPGLWEGHRKMLPKLKLSRDEKISITGLLHAALGEGIEVEGQALRQLNDAVDVETPPGENLLDLTVPKGGEVATT